MEKKVKVIFISKKLKLNFQSLNEGKSPEKDLYKFVLRAIKDLKENPSCGVKIPKKLWPKNYKKYILSNLWKYDLPNGWRLIYSIEQDEVSIINIILEWFNHKDYEKRFKY